MRLMLHIDAIMCLHWTPTTTILSHDRYCRNCSRLSNVVNVALAGVELPTCAVQRRIWYCLPARSRYKPRPPEAVSWPEVVDVNMPLQKSLVLLADVPQPRTRVSRLSP
jgi:hypothetical protein